MKKAWIAILFAACLAFSGCGSPQADTRPIALDQLTNSGGGYEFTELPFGKSAADIEKLLEISLNEPAFSNEDAVTHSLPDLYSLDGNGVQTDLEFRADQLHNVRFSLHPEQEAAQALFDKTADALAALYGTADDTTETEGALSSKGVRWDSTEGGLSTSLQLTLMTGDSISPVLSLAVGILP